MRPVPGLPRRAEGVAPESRTPTYAALELHVDNWRWQGVPFYIRAGKALARRATEVSVHFQQIPYCLFGREDVCQLIEPNVLVLRIQPDEGIGLSFATKVPGDDLTVGSVTMDFSYAGAFQREPGDAYEKLLLDAMRGDATLFARRDGDEQAWALLTPLLEAWEASLRAAGLLRARRPGTGRGRRAAAPRRPALEAAQYPCGWACSHSHAERRMASRAGRLGAQPRTSRAQACVAHEPRRVALAPRPHARRARRGR